MNRVVTPPADADVVYPASDGKPMAETGIHLQTLFWLYEMLRHFFRRRSDVYVAADMLLYYEPGNPRASRAPDVMVALGVPSVPERRSFFTWREGVVPQVIIEISSDSTVREDLGDKRDLYERLGVQEYFLFDPIGDCLNPRLQGFRHDAGAFVRLEPTADQGLTSQTLGVQFVPEGNMLRVSDAATGERMLTYDEQADRASRAHDLEAELARLRAALGDANPPPG
jgi:Uma2 family endonuclease